MIASSRSMQWIRIFQLGLVSASSIICSDDVKPGRVKPYPDLYLKTLRELGVEAAQAIVFEDSLNGVKAARAAGIFVVAVPNPVTALLGVDGADLKLESLAEFHLRDFMARM
jgi:putative hydrolase of the HAD superfamily